MLFVDNETQPLNGTWLAMPLTGAKIQVRDYEAELSERKAIVMMISMSDHHNSMGIGRQCVGTWLLKLLQVVLVLGTFGLWNLSTHNLL